MANYCYFQIKAVGLKDSLLKLQEYLDASYEYKQDENGNWYENCKADKHLFRIYETQCEDGIEEINENEYSIRISGECAWSVTNCMFDEEYTDYGKWRNSVSPFTFKGTTIPELSKELNLKIEIYSEETGVGFMEHYLIEDGKILIDDCVNYEEEYNEETDEYTSIGGIEWVDHI